MLKIAYSPIYKYELPEGHRFPMMKYELIPEQLLYEGSVTDENFFHPKKLSEDELLLTHTKEYLRKLDTLSLDKKEERNIGFPVKDTLIKRGKYISHGTLECARYAQNFGCAMNIAGGTHHSFADHGEGFCIYNDIAISSNILLKEGLVNKILIVDLDVHQGNGTAKIFEKDDRVFTFSMHGERNYPTRKERSDLDIGLPDKTEDELFLNTLHSTLPRLIDEVEPEFIFYLSGVDIIASDKLGRLSVSKEGCKLRDRFVFQQCKSNNIPVAVSMGGGYSPRISDIVDAHSNTFREALNIYF
jgi:acetoin utilization deacetylase AcuC-like enzyme